jgi:serine protease AprX
VLVKVGRSGHIPDAQIVSGLEWVLENKKKYDIRIVNISAGGDSVMSYLDSPLCQTVERAVREGLIVVCAVGNAGMAAGHPVLPPANSPAAISVGGLDDQNSLDRARRGMYRSSYGPTVDGLQKPEIIAPESGSPRPSFPRLQLLTKPSSARNSTPLPMLSCARLLKRMPVWTKTSTKPANCRCRSCDN